MPLLDQSQQPFSHHHNLMHPMAQHQQHNDSLSTLSLHSNISSSNSLSSSRLHSSCVDQDLETVDRELSALDASMPLVDPEITQDTEQLEKAMSRKRSRSEEDEDRLVREALSQFYLPSPRLLSGIDDCPLLMAPDTKRCKTGAHGMGSSSSSLLTNDHLLDFDFDHNHNQSQKDFEVIMDALRLGGTSPSNGNGACGDSCGQAAMMSENGVFHNLVVASLET